MLSLALSLALFGTPSGLWSCLRLKSLRPLPDDGGGVKRLLRLALALAPTLF